MCNTTAVKKMISINITISRARNCDHFGRICSRNVICATPKYLGAFVQVQIIAVVRPLQFSAKRSRITARMCHVTGS